MATTGGSEAVMFAMFACANPGDEALVVEPFYTNYNAFATLAGVKLVPLTSRAEDGFHLPARAAFEAARTPRTKEGSQITDCAEDKGSLACHRAT